MSRAVRLVVLLTAVAGLALGGCHRAAPTGVPAATVSSADPLGGVETRVDEIEKQIDRDGTG
jgi:hypothetical protein